MSIKLRNFNNETNHHNFAERQKLKPYVNQIGKFEGVLSEIKYRINLDGDRYRVGIFTSITSPSWHNLTITHLQIILRSKYRALQLFQRYEFIGTVNQYYLPKQIQLSDGTTSLVSAATYGVTHISSLNPCNHCPSPHHLSDYQKHEIQRIVHLHPHANYNAKTLTRYLLQLPDNGAREAMLNHYRDQIHPDNQNHLKDLLRLKEHRKSLYY